jgi:hypothetical protein
MCSLYVCATRDDLNAARERSVTVLEARAKALLEKEKVPHVATAMKSGHAGAAIQPEHDRVILAAFG